jgi:hypothetical protein
MISDDQVIDEASASPYALLTPREYLLGTLAAHRTSFKSEGRLLPCGRTLDKDGEKPWKVDGQGK